MLRDARNDSAGAQSTQIASSSQRLSGLIAITKSQENAFRTTMLKIVKTATGATFRVRVQPGASKNEIVGVQQDALKIRISAPPVEGKANKILIQFLAKQLAVKRSQVEILNGHATRRKTIHIIGEGTQKKLQDIIDRTSV